MLTPLSSFCRHNATSDRGRFSYMGGKGGPLWKHITYQLPPLSSTPTPPPSAAASAMNGSVTTPIPARPTHPHQGHPSGLNVQAADAQSQAAGPHASSACSNGTLPANGGFAPARTQCAPSSNSGGSGISGSCVPGIVEVEDASGRCSRHSSSFFEFLLRFVNEHRLGITPEAASQLPFDFWCGLVGYLGFELKAECGGARAHTSPTPDASMFFVDRMVAVDQLQGDVYVLAVHEREQQHQEQGSRSPSQQQQGSQNPCQQQQQQQCPHQQSHQYHQRLQESQHQHHQPVAAPATLASSTTSCSTSFPAASPQLHHQPQDSQQQHSSSPHQMPTQQAPNPTAAHQGVGVPRSASRTDAHNNGSLPCSSCAGATDTTTTTSATKTHTSESSRAQALAWVRSTVQQLKLLATDLSSPIPPSVSKGSNHHPSPSVPAVPTGTASIPSWQCTATCGGHPVDEPARAMATCLEDTQTLVNKDKQVNEGEGGVCQLPAFRLRHSRQQYMDNVRACKGALYEGESYEVCLTTTLQRRGVPDPRRLYHTLRTLNPAPYSAWLQCGLSGPTICCSSPERFLRGGRGGVLEARPIKGTAPRVKGDPAADAAAAAALASSEKDRAENLMIVDLIRNDLGRVCEVGSVHVPDLMEIESYATVHQMVSTVRGVRHAQASAVDCIRAAFPGGSMTGAPKIRTMEIIDALEGAARGVYSGSIGFISLNDTFDLNIVIRTAVVQPQARQQQNVGHQGLQQQQQQQQQQQVQARVQQASSVSGPNGFLEGATISIGAGGAIVVQSGIEEEYEEMRLKARALLSAVGCCDAECAYGNGEPARVDDQERMQML